MRIQKGRTTISVQVLIHILALKLTWIHHDSISKLLNCYVISLIILDDLIAIVYRETWNVVIDNILIIMSITHAVIHQLAIFLNSILISNPLVLLYSLQIFTGSTLWGEFSLP